MTLKFDNDFSKDPFGMVAQAARSGNRAAAQELARRLKAERSDTSLAKAARDVIDLAVTPNGRSGDASPLARPGYKGKRRLSDYEREIAHALIRKGHPKSQAIAMARGLLKKAAARGKWGNHGKAGAKTRAGAAASIAQRKRF